MACRMTRLAASAVDTTARAGTSDYRHWAEPVAVARSDPTQTPTPTTNWLAFLSSSGIHPKLSVSSPGDADEREADVVAERVMRMAAPAAAPLSAGRAGPAWPAPVRPVRRTTRMPGLPVRPTYPALKPPADRGGGPGRSSGSRRWPRRCRRSRGVRPLRRTPAWSPSIFAVAWRIRTSASATSTSAEPGSLPVLAR